MHHFSLFNGQRIFLFGLIVILETACTVKTLYNQLDWLLADHLESYVELNNEQQKLLYKQLDQTLLWHKSSQLPLYVQWLQDFKADISNKPTTQAVEQNVFQLQLFLRVLRSHAANELSPLLATLSTAQRNELYASMAKKNEEFADKFIRISRQEQIEQYIERMENRFDEWLGTVTDEQENLIKASAVSIKSVATEVLQTRRRWQAAFAAILEKSQSAVKRNQAMQDLFVDVERYRSDEYTKGARHNQQVFIRLIVDVAHTMTTQQWQYFNNKVDNYSRHFTEMAADARGKLAQP